MLSVSQSWQSCSHQNTCGSPHSNGLWPHTFQTHNNMPSAKYLHRFLLQVLQISFNVVVRSWSGLQVCFYLSHLLKQSEKRESMQCLRPCSLPLSHYHRTLTQRLNTAASSPKTTGLWPRESWGQSSPGAKASAESRVQSAVAVGVLEMYLRGKFMVLFVNYIEQQHILPFWVNWQCK